MVNQTRKRKKRILIVDDEPDMRYFVAANLNAKGFIAETASDGKEVLNIIKKRRPDLIILDVLMPVVDGFTLLHRLKSNASYSKIPVIMLTVKKEPKYLGKGIDMGAEFYLPKPFNFDNLMEFVKVAL